MSKSNSDDKFLNLLKSRFSLSKAFSKKWVKKVHDKWIKDYNIDTIDEISFPNLENKLQIPYIFATIESNLASIFETVPSIIMTQRGKLDRDFTSFADKIWGYIKTRAKLDEKIRGYVKDMLVSGMGFLRWGWDKKIRKVKEPVMQPVLNDDGQQIGQTETIEETEVVVKSDPIVKVFKYDEIYFSPESRFTMEDEENLVPYIIARELVSEDEVKSVYGVEIDEGDFEEIDVNSIDKELDTKDIDEHDKKRVWVYTYYGLLPSDFAGEGWEYDQPYTLVYTSKKILKQPEKIEKKPFILLSNYGDTHSFFKFGEPKVLRELEQDISLGRSRIADQRDKQGTKIALPRATKVNERQLKNPAEFTILRFDGSQPPLYVTPPPISETIIAALEQSRQDIQMASAQLDLSRGGTTSVVNTATGQKMFGQATERRIQQKRARIGMALVYLAKDLLKLSTLHWDAEKYARITDMSVDEVAPYIDKLRRIGEDYDVIIEEEDITMNKETRSAQAIALYRELKDNPNVNQEELLRKVLEIGFNVKDYERFLAETVNPEDALKAIQYFVETGMIDQQTAEMMAERLGQLVQQQEQAQNQPQGKVGRPPTKNPDEIVKKMTPGADNTQITAQNQVAYKQAGVSKGPQMQGGV